MTQKLKTAYLTILLFAGIGLSASPASALILGSVGVGSKCVGNTCFELRVIKDQRFSITSWGSAAETAKSLGGALATPDSKAENQVLIDLLHGAPVAWSNPSGGSFPGFRLGGWIGVRWNGANWINDPDGDGVGSVALGDGQAKGEYPWAFTEPNGQSYVAFIENVFNRNTGSPIGNLGWTDLNNAETFAGGVPSFFVETQIPEPATTLLLATGFAGMVFARRRKANRPST